MDPTAWHEKCGANLMILCHRIGTDEQEPRGAEQMVTISNVLGAGSTYRRHINCCIHPLITKPRIQILPGKESG
jgi:hypothetical protein